MRRAIALIAQILTLVSCRSANPVGDVDPGLRRLPLTEVLLSPGQSTDVGDLHVMFSRVLSDSRCPLEVQCPHAGDAAVEVGVSPRTAAGPLYMYRLVLHTHAEPRSAVVFGVEVTLMELTPLPTVGVPTPSESYQARIRLRGVDAITCLAC